MKDSNTPEKAPPRNILEEGTFLNLPSLSTGSETQNPPSPTSTLAIYQFLESSWTSGSHISSSGAVTSWTVTKGTSAYNPLPPHNARLLDAAAQWGDT
ncbi:hypothetical protein CCR75_001914 [Bremia lactucae]|uniref:Uncharacterized protein n=1 Tax=Bremia lactucae TaxID=4779 RepID=A0A976ID06_BRELC|nr:hypothetical protein CCR75_001914 [Bremia lactucae]